MIIRCKLRFGKMHRDAKGAVRPHNRCAMPVITVRKREAAVRANQNHFSDNEPIHYWLGGIAPITRTGEHQCQYERCRTQPRVAGALPGIT